MNDLHTAIVIVNWNGWEDTVRCIAACGHLEDFNGAVLVVDNGSTDGSYDHILAWCHDQIKVASTSADARIAALEQRGFSPLTLVAAGDEALVSSGMRDAGLTPRGLYIVRASENTGFGEGNNVGLRLAMLDPHCRLFWLLNSDAIPEPNALKELEWGCLAITEPLVSGSVLLNYDEPMTVQALGAKVSYVTLKTTHMLENAPVHMLDMYPPIYVIGAPIGAAMMINRPYIEQLGMFDERMFLYYEEQDLVSRLPRRQSFVCTRSRVYHKGGQSTKGGQTVADRSRRADYEFLRSRTLLSRKIGDLAVLISIFTAVVSWARRRSVGRKDLAGHVLPAFLDGWRSASTPMRSR